MQRFNQCKVCESSRLINIKHYRATPELNPLWHKTFQDLLPEKNRLSITLSLCGNCGFVFYRDVFDEGEMEKLYATEGRYETGEVRNMKPGRKRELDLLFRYFEAHIPLKEITSIIDVGAGDFAVLNHLMKQYPGKQYVAVDPSFSGDTYQGARVLHTMVEKAQYTESYDLVMLTHVLEHVADLDRFMQHILPLVKRYAYIEVPFQVGPSLFLNRSVNTQHINYFTPETLERLLGRFGLTVRSLRFENDWYRYNGMPGMIRVVAERKNTTPTTSHSFLATLWHLMSPWPFVKSFVFSKR